MRYFLIIGLALLVAGCEEEQAVIKNFDLVYSESGYHFVHVKGEAVGSTTLQREAASALCKRLNPDQDCQVFLWKNRDEIPEKFPIRRSGADTMGYVQIVDGKIKQKTLK